MLFKSSTIAAVLTIIASSSISQTNAFQPATTTSTSWASSRNKISNQRIMTSLSMAEEVEMTEVERLRAAAAKAREEYERLSKEMGKDVTSSSSKTADAPTPKNLSATELQTIAKSINFASGDATTQSTALDALVDSGDFSSWKSAIRRGPTTASSAMSLLKPYPVTLKTLESRTDGKVTAESLGVGGEGDVKFEDFQDLTIAVVLGSSLVAVGALAFLPPNVGASLSYLFALIPVIFVGIGSTSPGIIAAFIKATRGDSDDVDVRERICRHEAGHFLCGYMCGLPVKNYAVSSDTGVACVEFHTNGNAASATSATGELSEEDIAHLAVVAMSGSVAEILAYGQSKGGENDLLELQNCFRRSQEFIGAAKQQDLTRWGALTSYSLIKANFAKYEGLVNAFKENKSLAECVAIIEASA